MPQPDIIFLVLDTQRADRLGCYGHKPARTPNLDRFADEAVLFVQGIAPAQWTVPSHASMFTGLYPTAHQVTQSHQALGPERPHLAELLRQAGYDTVAFCNNPLVGILNNGFKRGFDRFFNYGGAFPSTPAESSSLPWPLSRLAAAYTQFLRRISYPVQNFFARSELAFILSINALMTPLWSRLANFKGQNERSVGDVIHFLQEREQKKDDQPLFMFVNLMETHLPFWPPRHVVDEVAPYLHQDAAAKARMRAWNREAYRWQAPLAEPLPELDQRVLDDLYDAEVAYQDGYLGPLFDFLGQRANKENTLTVIVGDHGDGIGEHGYMGHAFVAYQELVHVPLLLHWPAKLTPTQIETPVSTRRVYHTMLDAAAAVHEPLPHLDAAEVRGLTLLETVRGREPEQAAAYSEIYPPLNFVKAIERRQPELLEPYGCYRVRRALVREQYKLIQIDDAAAELYDLAADPTEQTNLIADLPEVAHNLNDHLNRVRRQTELQRESFSVGAAADGQMDDHLLQRLRGLGYLE
ncbi:MAG: sulfatase [Chloroflexi bacterium]|nr:sulfatase [Chloroflexota bacterium]